ncbi:hypothetical protein D3C71_1302590 [compost metagenome]
MRFGGEQALVEMLWITLQGDHVQRGDARGQLQQIIGAGEGQAGEAGHHCSAVHQRQGFFRTQHQRLPAEFAMHFCSLAAFAAEHHFAFAGQRGGDVGQWRQITAGTHRALFRNQRQNVVFEERLQAFQQLHPNPGNAVAQRLQTRRQHRAGGLGIEQFAQPAAVERVQVLRQRLDVMQRHCHHAGIAIAGGHAIDHAFLVQQGIEEPCPFGNALAVRRVALQLRRRLTVGQGQHVFDAQREFAEGYRLKRWRRHRSSRKGKS